MGGASFWGTAIYLFKFNVYVMYKLFWKSRKRKNYRVAALLSNHTAVYQNLLTASCCASARPTATVQILAVSDNINPYINPFLVSLFSLFLYWSNHYLAVSAV